MLEFVLSCPKKFVKNQKTFLIDDMRWSIFSTKKQTISESSLRFASLINFRAFV